MTADPKSRVQVYHTEKGDRKCYQGVGSLVETFSHTPLTYSDCLLKQAALDVQDLQNPMTLVEWKTQLSDPVDQKQMSEIRACKLNAINDFQCNMNLNLHAHGKSIKEIVLMQSKAAQQFVQNGGMQDQKHDHHHHCTTLCGMCECQNNNKFQCKCCEQGYSYEEALKGV